jgi:hypothetical protein
MVRRAFPATSDISGEFRFRSEVRLVVLFTGTSFVLRIRICLIDFLTSTSLFRREAPMVDVVRLSSQPAATCALTPRLVVSTVPPLPSVCLCSC